MEGLIIRKIDPASKEDLRGPTYEWCKGLNGLQVTIYKRKKGSLSGTHYHKGNDPSKNPERFFLVEGQLLLKALNRQGQQLEEVIKAGTEFLIYPNILHSMKALTNIIFLEYRTTVFDKSNSDTYSAETYLI